jgi:hypothetical protein
MDRVVDGTTILEETQMDIKQQRMLQALRRVQAWCAANPALVPAPVLPGTAWSPLTRQLDTLNTLVAQSTAAAAEQGVQKKRATLDASDEPSLRKHLRAEMRTVTQVAKALRQSVPGIGILKMPPPSVHTEVLLAAADALAKQASTYESVLVEHGLAPDFLAHLASAASALKASLDGRGAARAGRVSATRQVRVALSLGRQYVQIMDAALTKALKDEPARLVEWKHARRVTLKGTPVVDIITTTPPPQADATATATGSQAA